MMPSDATEAADKLKGQVRLIVVTPEKAAFDGIGEMIVLPMHDGELGVLPGRAALIGRLGAGELRLKAPSGTTRFFIDGGFVQVRNNVVSVLTGRARPAAEITQAMADQAAAELETLPATNAAERANKSKARDRASGMKKVAAHNTASA
jgi:F-type H+-transporting ATPase subunit epsilon